MRPISCFVIMMFSLMITVIIGAIIYFCHQFFGNAAKWIGILLIICFVGMCFLMCISSEEEEDDGRD